MKYQDKSFTLPSAPPNITQEKWDRIFRPTVERAVAVPQKGPKPESRKRCK